MVLTIFEPWPNYKILASHALKLFKFESAYLKKKNCGSEKIVGPQKCIPKNLGSEKICWIKKLGRNFGQEKCFGPKSLLGSLKNFGSKKC